MIFCVRLLKGADQSFAFCGRSGSLYHGRNDIDIGLLRWSRVELVVISRIELHDLVTLPKLLNDIAMSIRDKFIGWLEMLD